MELLEHYGETVDGLRRLLSDDDWPAFVSTHTAILGSESQAALTFLAAEIVEQLLHRINDRYPVDQGYSPVHIAIVAVYRAMRAAYDQVAAA